MIAVKKLLPVLALWILIALPAEAQDDEKICLVVVRDYAKVEAYQILTETELKELQATIKLEMRFHSRALTLASKEWRKDEQLKKKNFPRSAVSMRQVKILGTFDGREQAEERQSIYEERDIARAERREEQAKERDKIRYGGDTSRASKARAREREREFFDEQAMTLYSAALQALMAPPEKKGQAEPED